ncbi:MAG: aroQ [Burkholderiales bacterium]|jgi:3-dehydroquinate dehydratase-2|nr:aroQ [Burkholderiales bacterium]
MQKISRILVLHGPNLNLLGKREPETYGLTTLEKINENLATRAAKHNLTLECFQSNCEGELITKAQSALNNYDFIIINPAGLTHTSVALRDAILASGKPCIEVHLSNIYKREEFRHFSFFSDIAIGVISGFGEHSYYFALEYIVNSLKFTKE